MTLWVCRFLEAAGTISLWNDNVWSLLIQLGIIAVAILVANSIRRKVKFIKKSLLPTPVIGGIILLLLKFIPFFDNLIDKDFMEMLTYHALGLGFISMSLKVVDDRKEKKDRNKLVVMDTGILTVNTYLVQAIVGLGTTLILAVTVLPSIIGISAESLAASGVLLPLGYGQGPGQALNFGKIFEEGGFTGGASFGLAVAAVGFLFACIGGVIYMNYLIKKGKLKKNVDGDESGLVTGEEVSMKNEIPLTESVDKFTVQFAIILAVYFATYLVMSGISYLAVEYLGNFGVNTVRPLIWGFNFLFGVIFSVVAKKIMEGLTKTKLMKRQYPNNFLLNRISGFMFDIMIISGICAIEVEDLGGLFIPLLAICLIGGIATLIYVRFVCNKIYPDYPNEAFFSMFGMLTGTASTGMILLREIDPKFETPAANNLVFQSVPAIAFGFPLLLLIPMADDSLMTALIVLGIVAAMFVVYNLILFRTFIFKKKSKK